MEALQAHQIRKQAYVSRNAIRCFVVAVADDLRVSLTSPQYSNVVSVHLINIWPASVRHYPLHYHCLKALTAYKREKMKLTTVTL